MDRLWRLRISRCVEKEKDMTIIWESRQLEELGGSNSYGQLGRVKPKLGMKPIDLPFPVFIASGLGHSLAICHDRSSATKKASSWGWNMSSHLGRSGPEYILQFIVELTEENPVSVAGGMDHSVVLMAKKEVCVWGSGRNGQLGTGSSSDEAELVLLEALEGVEVLRVACGLDHTLLLVSECNYFSQ